MLEVDSAALEGLTAPILVVAFEGWVSAGSAGTVTADHIAADAPVVARFDSEELYDYRVSRPSADFSDGVLDSIVWPELAVRRRRGKRDLLVVNGPEPNWHWKGMAATVDVEMHEEKIRQLTEYVYSRAYSLFVYSPLTLYAVNKEVNFVPQKLIFLRLKETSVTENHWSVRGKNH